MAGFIAMHREALDHPLLKDGERFRAWFWLIANAAWKATKHNARGRTIAVKRGQICIGREHLAKAWGWSPSAVERFLTRLETEHMIERETGQGKSVITVCNYSKYQTADDEPGHMSGQQAGQTSDRHRTAKEEGNKGIREGEEAKASPPPRARRAAAAPDPRLHRMPVDWVPGPLPADVAQLVAQWPPGRMEREAAGTRDYWLTQATKRPGWDLTFHNRIRQIHDQVLRDNRDGRNRQDQQHPVAPSGRSMGRTEAAARAVLDARSSPPSVSAGRGNGERAIALPHAVRS